MDHGFVADRHQLPDNDRVIVRQMHHRTVLDIGPRPYVNAVDVPAQNRVVPNARFLLQSHVANDRRRLRDEDRWMNGRFATSLGNADKQELGGIFAVLQKTL